MHTQFQHDRKKPAEENMESSAELPPEVFQENFAEGLRDALLAGMMKGTIITPVSHIELLKTTIETACSIIGAESGGLFLVDEQTNELVFEAVVSGVTEELRQFRMSAADGIAGHVAQTRQSMIINDVINNQYWNKQVGLKAGGTPRNIISTPLLRGDRLIGVLEVCDKKDAEMFLDTDMRNLKLFANQVSIEIELSRSHRTVTALIAELLETCGHLTQEQKQQLREESFRLTGFFNQDAQYRQRLELAQLVQAIAWRGEEELGICHTILRGFADYLA